VEPSLSKMSPNATRIDKRSPQKVNRFFARLDKSDPQGQTFLVLAVQSNTEFAKRTATIAVIGVTFSHDNGHTPNP